MARRPPMRVRRAEYPAPPAALDKPTMEWVIAQLYADAWRYDQLGRRCRARGQEKLAILALSKSRGSVLRAFAFKKHMRKRRRGAQELPP